MANFLYIVHHFFDVVFGPTAGLRTDRPRHCGSFKFQLSGVDSSGERKIFEHLFNQFKPLFCWPFDRNEIFIEFKRPKIETLKLQPQTPKTKHLVMVTDS